MTSYLPSQSLREASPHDSPPPAEWMPLDEVAQAWATFAASTRHPWGWQATSSAFAALAQEAAACQQADGDEGTAQGAR